MNINTKYNYGDLVYPISTRREKVKVPRNCPVCKDTGTVTLNNNTYSCPECRGYTYHTVEGEIEWYADIYYKGKIGKIDIEFYAPKYKREGDSKICYMLDSTGVGSGTVWEERNLFLSCDEAEKECIRRNDEIRKTNKTE
jgi:hypothetical protein